MKLPSQLIAAILCLQITGCTAVRTQEQCVAKKLRALDEFWYNNEGFQRKFGSPYYKIKHVNQLNFLWKVLRSHSEQIMRERNELYSVDWFYELRLESVYEANSEDCGRVCVEGDNIRDALIRYERIKWPFIAGLIEKHGQEIEAEQRKFRDSLFHAFHTKPANEWIAMVKSTGFLPQIEQESGIAFSKGEGSYEDRKAYSDVLASILTEIPDVLINAKYIEEDKEVRFDFYNSVLMQLVERTAIFTHRFSDQEIASRACKGFE